MPTPCTAHVGGPPRESLPRHDGDGLTAGQLDGVDCIHCGRFDGTMRPVACGRHGQLFAHAECARDKASREASPESPSRRAPLAAAPARLAAVGPLSFRGREASAPTLQCELR